MSAAERIRPTRRQVLQDQVAAAASVFAANLADAIVAYQLAPPDGDEPAPKRRRAQPPVAVPANEPESTPEELARAIQRMSRLRAR